MAAQLIESRSGKFQPEKMPNEYARAVHELVRAKVEHRAPEVVFTEEKPTAKVINIMAALKESMHTKGRAKVKDAVRRKMGKERRLKSVLAPAPSRRGPAHDARRIELVFVGPSSSSVRMYPKRRS